MRVRRTQNARMTYAKCVCDVHKMHVWRSLSKILWNYTFAQPLPSCNLTFLMNDPLTTIKSFNTLLYTKIFSSRARWCRYKWKIHTTNNTYSSTIAHFQRWLMAKQAFVKRESSSHWKILKKKYILVNLQISCYTVCVSLFFHHPPFSVVSRIYWVRGFSSVCVCCYEYTSMRNEKNIYYGLLPNEQAKSKAHGKKYLI